MAQWGQNKKKILSVKLQNKLLVNLYYQCQIHVRLKNAKGLSKIPVEFFAVCSVGKTPGLCVGWLTCNECTNSCNNKGIKSPRWCKTILEEAGKEHKFKQ